MHIKNPKLLIIYPGQLYAPDWGRVNTVKPHLMNLFSFIFNNGFKVRLLDLECELGRPKTKSQIRQFKEKASRLITEIDFDIVAISCYTSLNYLGSLMIAEVCKKINAGCLIVVGGYHPSALPADFIYEKSPFDFIVRGEGERTLMDICTGKIPKGNSPRLIQGVPLNLQNNLVLRWKEYGYLDPNRHYHLYLSRGCPFHCAFCSELCKGSTGWRAYPVDKAIRQIERLIVCNNPRKIGISDACFGFNQQWRRNFLGRLAKTGIDKILGLECRVDMLEKKDVDLLSRLNSNVIFGLESGSPKMIAIMQKALNPQRYLKRCFNMLRYMNKKEVPHKIYLVFNHPGETRFTYKETIAFLKSVLNSQNSMSGYIVAQNYAFFPGSHIFEHLKDYQRRYGTKVTHKAWWKEPQDHARLAREVIASNDLGTKVTPGNFWEKDILDLNHRIFQKMSPGIKAFWWDAHRKEPAPSVSKPLTQS